MAVYTDDVGFKYGNMLMSHMWADSEEELIATARKLGLRDIWIQRPPKATWVHYDISRGKRNIAVAKLGVILTDKYGALEFVARKEGNLAQIELIEKLRAQHAQGRIFGTNVGNAPETDSGDDESFRPL